MRDRHGDDTLLLVVAVTLRLAWCGLKVNGKTYKLGCDADSCVELQSK